MVPLSSVDLNLLVAFDALVTERHVTRAAARLGRTQSALSHALQRLRCLFDDKLFIRGPEGMRPTVRALEIHQDISEMLQRLQRTLSSPASFDPANSTRRFRLAVPDAVAPLLLPRLFASLRSVAPHVQIDCLPSRSTHGWDPLVHGEVELAIAAHPCAGLRLMARELPVAQPRLAIADARNPRLYNGQMSLHDYLESPQVLVASDARAEGVTETGVGVSRRVVAILPSYALVPAIVRGTELVGHCGPNIIEHLDYRHELVLFEPPVPIARETLRVAWRRSAAEDVGLNWLVEVLAQTAVH